MCLAAPARVDEILSPERARVSLGGIRKEISIALVENVAVGDYVILHVGYALAKIDEAEAERTLAALIANGIDPTEDWHEGETGGAEADARLEPVRMSP